LAAVVGCLLLRVLLLVEVAQEHLPASKEAGFCCWSHGRAEAHNTTLHVFAVNRCIHNVLHKPPCSCHVTEDSGSK
jgi:hypothetical protein